MVDHGLKLFLKTKVKELIIKNSIDRIIFKNKQRLIDNFKISKNINPLVI